MVMDMQGLWAMNVYMPLCSDNFHVKPSCFDDEHVQIGPPACWCIFILLKPCPKSLTAM